MSKTHITILVILSVAILAFIFFSNSGQEERVIETTVIENNDYSLSFSYPAGAEGYELIESSTSDDYLHSYVLVDKEALLEYQANTSETAPPTISVFIFQVPESGEENGEERPGRITRLQNWAQANSGITSFSNIYGAPDVVEIDGVKALEYTTDGVYQQAVYLISYQGFIYMFVGQYDRPTDYIKSDFETLIQSIRFG